jgi:hypothetical protein
MNTLNPYFVRTECIVDIAVVLPEQGPPVIQILVIGWPVFVIIYLF